MGNIYIYNGEVLDEEEVNRITVLLQKEIFKNSNIVLVCQSMESNRYEIQKKVRLHYNKYQFKKLLEQADFEIFELSFLLRSSQQINNMVDAALPILSKAVMEYIVPKDAVNPHNKLTMPAITTNSETSLDNINTSTSESYQPKLLKNLEHSNETFSNIGNVNKFHLPSAS